VQADPDPEFRTYCHLFAARRPYDGGAHLFLPTPEKRDRTRDRHADRLSRHPSGL
jgi:hypothetical protein